MTERGERVDDRLEAGCTGELKDPARCSQDGGSNGTTGGRYHQGKRRNEKSRR